MVAYNLFMGFRGVTFPQSKLKFSLPFSKMLDVMLRNIDLHSYTNIDLYVNTIFCSVL